MKKYVKKVVNYAAGSMANKLLLLLLLPLFSRFLTPSQYAVYTNMMLFISFAGLFYLLGIQQALFSYYNFRKTDDYRSSLISSTYITVIISGLLFTSLISIFSRSLSLWLVRDAVYSQVFILIGIILFFNNITAVTLSLLNVMERSGSYALLSLMQNGIFFILIIYGSITANIDVTYVFSSLAAATILGSIAAIFIITPIRLKFGHSSLFTPKIIFPVISFGLIMIPGTISVIILRAADRLMLTHLTAGGIEKAMYAVGIYAMSYKIGSIMQFGVTLMNTVFLPYAMRIADSVKSADIYRKTFLYYLLGGGLLGFFIILFSREIFVFLIDENYYTAASLTFIGVISTWLQGLFNLINVSFYAKQKAGNITIAVTAGAFINIALNFVLIPRFGIYGAGAASLAAYLFIVVYNYICVKKKYQPGYKFIFLPVVLFIFAIAALINAILPYNPLYFAIKILSSLLLLLIIRVIIKRSDEISKFKAIIRK